jgi:pimeloyl-ACP methyl ester carboxylesterase
MTSLSRLLVLIAALFTLTAALPAAAEVLPVPSQADWAAAKKTVKLANGITLAYVEMGDSAGEPLLLLHGYTDNSRSWSLVAPHLTKRRVLALDLRGHGKSDAPACCYSFADFADDAAGFLDAMGIAKADVVGHSLGSLVAQMLAAQHPEKIDKLVLISSTLAVGSGPGSWLWDNVMKLSAPIDPNSAFMKDWYANPNPVDADFLDRERAESAAVPLPVWRGVLWGLASGDLTPIAPAVKAPILVLWGEKDGLFDLAHQERLEKAYPEAEFQVFSGAGHNMFWEYPQKAASLIEEFLDWQPQ